MTNPFTKNTLGYIDYEMMSDNITWKLINPLQMEIKLIELD